MRGGAGFRSLSHALNQTGRHTHHAPGLHCKTAPGWRRATLRRDGTRAKSRHFRPPKARLGPCPGPLSFLCSYVVVLGGVHVYKMDDGLLFSEHSECGADMTVACPQEPLANASELGLMTVNAQDRIVAFE